MADSGDTRDEAKKKKRQYSNEFLQFGFTVICTGGVDRPQCVICNDILSAESMKPNKLKCHLTKHQNFIDKDIEFFAEKVTMLRKPDLTLVDNFSSRMCQLWRHHMSWH